MKHLITIPILLITASLLAQPMNDDCSGIVQLGAAPICPSSVVYNNVLATESNIGSGNLPPCFVGSPVRDVWFSFVATSAITDYRISVDGAADNALGIGAMKNPQVAVYRGNCGFNGLQLLYCRSAANGQTNATLDLEGLTPGATYFLRVNDWSPVGTNNTGAFKLCVAERPPVTTIVQGGSELCSGTLCDSGGPTGDYSNNEDNVFTICPTEPHGCINFSLKYFNIENVVDAITFYDGPDISSPVLGSLGGGGLVFENPTNSGVCYSVSASSGCLTIRFTSDGTGTFEGFCGSWECSPGACQPLLPLSLNPAPSEEEILNDLVSGQTNVTITNIDCAPGAYGTFMAGGNTDLGLEKGLLLTSGQASLASNPGVEFATASNNFPGDPDLDYLSTLGGNSIQSADACIVELDVYAQTDAITFEYIFGSEEYPLFVGSSFNDIFAFFVSGPGITGDPNIGNQENIAKLPDGTFIQINSVNSFTNWQYYRNNENGPSVVYNGLTSDSLGVKKSLTARINTIPCNTYHVKLAIADRGDMVFDSGVFISEFSNGSPGLSVNFKNGVNYLVEECSAIPDEITISLDAPVSQPATYNVQVGGTGTPGVDYTLDIPPTLTFTPNQSTFVFPVSALSDGLTEGIDTISIQLSRDFGCGEVELSTLFIEIHDNLEVDILNDQMDTVYVCGECIQLEATGAMEYFWQPPGLFSNPGVANPEICPDSSRWVSVTGTDGICTDVDSVFLQIIRVGITPDSLTVCGGETISLLAESNVANGNFVWSSPDMAIPGPANPQLTVTAPPGLSSATFTVSVDLGGCAARDEIEVSISIVEFPELANDTLVCQNYSVRLGSDIATTTTVYNWTPATGLSDPTVSGPLATPDVSTSYKLVASNLEGTCKDSAFVNVAVIPADIEIIQADTTFICVGDSVTLNSVSSTQGVGVTWSSAGIFTQLAPEAIRVGPVESTWYYATLQTADCKVVDSVLVYVDSLPDLTIMAMPDKSSYCQGDEVQLLSPTYEPANFPGIETNWVMPLPGALTPDSFLNLVFLAVQTHTFRRVTTVHACSQIDSIFIKVVPVASLMVVPDGETICVGGSIQLNAIGDPAVTKYTWSPPNGLSCTDCPNPVASPVGSTAYQVEGEFDGCPVGGSGVVNVVPLPGIVPPPNPDICPGDAIALNLFNDPNTEYVWTSSDNSLNTTDKQPVVNPQQTTTYFFQATNSACTNSGQVTINVATDFTLSVSDGAVICEGDGALVKATTNQPGLLYSWRDKNGVLIFTGAEFNASPRVDNVYTVTVQDMAQPPCFVHIDSVLLDVIPRIEIDSFKVEKAVQDSVVEIFEGDEISLAVFTSPISGGATYEWFLFDKVFVTTNSPNSGVFNAPEVNGDQEFTYAVLITGPNGCAIYQQIKVIVKDNPVKVPNVFTPNGDQLNNNFTLLSKAPVELLGFKVWNRWGKLVYDNENGLEGWDGTYKNEPAHSDVYVYYIEYQIVGGSNKPVVLKGDVTLLR